MVFHWSLSDSDSKYLQVSRTLLSILADLNNVVIWMVSTRLQSSQSSSPFNNPSVTEIRASIIIIIELFTSTLADGFSLESGWQQVSSSP